MPNQGKKQGDFTEGKVSSGILRLAGPMILAQLVGVLYNIVDRIYIGHQPGVGQEALTGIGILFPIIMLCNAFASWAGQGGSALFAIERGHGDEETASKVLHNSAIFLLASAMCLVVISYLFEEAILLIFGAQSESLVYAEQYLEIYLLGVPFQALSLGLNPFLAAQGFPKRAMGTVIIGAGLNIVLDPIFIYALNLGIRGAAIATVISQFVSACWLLYYLRGERAPITLKISKLKLAPKLLLEILKLGFANFVFQLTNSLTMAVANSTLLRYGGELHVGIMTAVVSIRQIFTLPINGLAIASKPFLSFNYGAERMDRVHEGIVFMTKLCGLLCLLSTILIQACPGLLLKIFNSDADFIQEGIPAVRSYFALFFFLSLQMVGQHTFTALGKAKEATFFSLLRKVFLILPLTLWLPKLAFFGVLGVYWAESISQIIGGSICYRTMWQRVIVENPRYIHE